MAELCRAGSRRVGLLAPRPELPSRLITAGVHNRGRYSPVDDILCVVDMRGLAVGSNLARKRKSDRGRREEGDRRSLDRKTQYGFDVFEDATMHDSASSTPRAWRNITNGTSVRVASGHHTGLIGVAADVGGALVKLVLPQPSRFKTLCVRIEQLEVTARQPTKADRFHVGVAKTPTVGNYWKRSWDPFPSPGAGDEPPCAAAGAVPREEHSVDESSKDVGSSADSLLLQRQHGSLSTDSLSPTFPWSSGSCRVARSSFQSTEREDGAGAINNTTAKGTAASAVLAAVCPIGEKLVPPALQSEAAIVTFLEPPGKIGKSPSERLAPTGGVVIAQTSTNGEFGTSSSSSSRSPTVMNSAYCGGGGGGGVYTSNINKSIDNYGGGDDIASCGSGPSRRLSVSTSTNSSSCSSCGSDSDSEGGGVGGGRCSVGFLYGRDRGKRRPRRRSSFEAGRDFRQGQQQQQHQVRSPLSCAAAAVGSVGACREDDHCDDGRSGFSGGRGGGGGGGGVSISSLFSRRSGCDLPFRGLADFNSGGREAAPAPFVAASQNPQLQLIKPKPSALSIGGPSVSAEPRQGRLCQRPRPPGLTLGVDEVDTEVCAGRLTKATQVLENLWLSGQEVTGDKVSLQREGVTHIVNCSERLVQFYPKDFSYHRVSWADESGQNMEPAVLEAAFRHIDAARRDGKACLVHCKKGTSRSCSLVIGYLMQFGEGMSLLAAFEFCQAKRRQCNPDKYFLEKLSEYEECLFGQTSVSLDDYHRGDPAGSLVIESNTSSNSSTSTCTSAPPPQFSAATSANNINSSVAKK